MIVWNFWLPGMVVLFPSQVPIVLAIALMVIQIIYYLLLTVRVYLGQPRGRLFGNNGVSVSSFLCRIMRRRSQRRRQVQQIQRVRSDG
jgi:hypothetical protein